MQLIQRAAVVAPVSNSGDLGQHPGTGTPQMARERRPFHVRDTPVIHAADRRIVRAKQNAFSSSRLCVNVRQGTRETAGRHLPVLHAGFQWVVLKLSVVVSVKKSF